MHVRTKFSLRLIIILFLFILSGVFCILIVTLFDSLPYNLTVPVVIAFGLFLFLFTWVIFFELRGKALSVRALNDVVSIKNFAGLGISKELDLKDIDGYSISILSTRFRKFEYLNLIKGDRYIHLTSEYYHTNYKEFKDFISQKIPFKGFERFGVRRGIREWLG